MMKNKLKKAVLPLAFPLLLFSCQSVTAPTPQINVQKTSQISDNLSNLDKLQKIGARIYSKWDQQSFQNDYYQAILKNYQPDSISDGFSILSDGKKDKDESDEDHDNGYGNDDKDDKDKKKGKKDKDESNEDHDKGHGNDDKNDNDDNDDNDDSPEACKASTGNGPAQPTFLINEDFANSSDNFGSDGNWGEWGGDYYTTAKGVSLWNPGPGQGVRDNPGELVQFGKTGLLQTGIYKTMKLNYNSGDKLIAKLLAAPTFTHNDSDVTFLLVFDDPDNTVAVSSSLRGAGTKWQELYIESEIPACATQVTVSVLGYLGLNESSSLTLEKMSLEQIPANHYTRTQLLNETLDGVEDNQFGANSPANLDGEFGYDFFSVANWPEKYAGDRAVTTSKASGSGIGNITKRVDLPAYNSGDKITALMYVATTFTDANSDTSFALKFYDEQGNLLSTETSALMSTNHYRWLILDRVAIPAGASYVEMAPGVSFGDNETSSMLWDNMLMYLYQG